MADTDTTQDTTVGDHTVIDDFIAFLQEYGVIGLAIAVVMGTATKDLVNAIVESIIMPLIAVLLPGENWREAIFAVGPVEFGIGQLIGALLDFLIIALVIYLFVKLVLGRENVEKIG